MTPEQVFRSAVWNRLPKRSYLEVQVHHSERHTVQTTFLQRGYNSAVDLSTIVKDGLPHTLFWGVCPRKRTGNKTADVLGVNMLWTDMDVGTLDLSDLPGPTACIRSGTKTNAHLYWFLDDIYEPDDSMAAILYGVHIHLGADTTFDFTRRMRIPGSLNHKSTPPVQCSVQFFFPDRVYPAEAFLKWARVRKGVTYTHSSLQMLQPVDIDALGLHPTVREMIEYGSQSTGAQRYLRGDLSIDRSRMDMAIGRALKEAGCSPEQTAWVLRTYECGGRCRAIRHGLRYLEYTVNALYYR
jgi:hypothetical protein